MGKKLTKEQITKALGILSRMDARRFFWKASGYIDHDLERPVIAIANSVQDAGVGHMHLRELGRHVKESIYAAGGTPIEFSVIAPCAGYAKATSIGDDILLYDLPQRDVIADSIEIQMMNYGADGLVCIGTCDKIVPGMWLGAARLNLPTIFLLGGPALPGKWGEDETVFPSNIMVKCLNRVLSGEMTEEELDKEIAKMESCWICGPGACPELTTANTVMVCTEAMGLCLPGVSTTPGGDIVKLHQARETGHAIMELVKKSVTFDRIVTRGAIEDAIRCIMAVSGSTNGILHLLTLAVSMDMDLNLDDFERIGRNTPYLAPLRPSGPYSMVDFHRSGGVMALLNELRDALTLGRPTVAGVEFGKLLHPGVNRRGDAIRSKSNPVYPTGGIVVMKGNLAPQGALVRHTIAGTQGGEFTGPAICYDKQTDALLDVLTGKVSSGDVLVIRYQGPRGGPGFSENFKVVLLLDAMGLNDVAVITDSRFSGATEGALYAGYISPEAFAGGPLAAVHNGDRITISIKNRRIDVHLSDEEIKKRLEGFEPPESRIKTGVLVDWRLTATQFHEGAMLKRKL
ncbi:MAG: dihydroxy-acid dehydratase [Desulfobacterales bacterium]